MSFAYAEALEWLTTLHKFGIKLGLEQTRELADLCGSPDRGLRFIHLAGTNGKGSTGAMLESALRSNGLATGFYSSPHLISACERIRVNGCAVSENEFADTAWTVKKAVDQMAANGASPTYFEVTTVMAMLIFRRHNCDYVVWETGMGGRLDSTNIVEPVISVITNIALDHEKYLGTDLPAIAAEKAGIIKPQVPVAVGVMAPEALAVIKARAEEVASAFWQSAEVAPVTELYAQEMRLGYQKIRCGGKIVELQLNGLMQHRNASLAITVLKVLDLWNDAAVRGLYQTRWPGRMECIGNGRFLLDGGHNPDGIAALAETLKSLYPGKKFDFIFGAFADKDFTGGLRILAPLMKSLQAVSFAEEARLSAAPEDICREAELLGVSDCRCVDDLASALAENAGKITNEPTVIAGSLYLAGEVLELLGDRQRVLNLI